ncbi:MAG TPA: acyl-CoA dehydrogenase, partial [Steroidobacteraceae bacterium]|jgi:acyl-CoA dehydrogenase|nr:acyl-CoA dehydrogenase [Steroidobacteraceae bacterium]
MRELLLSAGVVIGWLVLFVGAICILAYRRVSLAASTGVLVVLLAGYWALGAAAVWWKIFVSVPIAILFLWNIRPLRIRLATRPFMKKYRKLLPPMSSTESEALDAGTVWWDGELFTGGPNWPKLMSAKVPVLTPVEQAFLDGPCEELCAMLDDWDITHRRADMPAAVWSFIKSQGFFAMIIPRRYGGLEFSAYAHSCVLIKIASRSVTASSTIAVPNSLGPAELLLHYGTEAQKNHYLPRLARGEDVPCFALTGPRAGSDAASIPDTGIICRGQWQGREIIGIRLNFSKRYITLAPIATVIGLAFRLYDPEQLMGAKTDLGITCALIPRDTPGVAIGRRHFPLNIPFQNGPIQGHGVFVPLDAIIGGFATAGQGWRMLVEQLSVGRCISLPSSATGGAKAAVYASGAYARIRRQFSTPIGSFEGIEQVLARMAARTYIIDAARSVTAGAIDGGEKPSVPSAMLKFHATEIGRMIANDAMDVHGGKGICLGPKNYLGRGYQLVPIGITVEGANILTRNLIIFGQGAVRCHPFVLKEMNAAKNPNREAGVREFDAAVVGHVGFAISNAVRSLILGLTSARFTRVPDAGATARFYQHVNRYSASFALATDVAMLALGGYLKKKETLSARLGDVLSSMYLASMVLKHHANQGSSQEDLPLIEWACRSLLYQAQEQLHLFLRNFPNRSLALFMRLCIFPRGLAYSPPSDRLGHAIGDLVMNPSAARDRLCAHIYKTAGAHNPLGQLQEALLLTAAAEPLEKRIRVDGVKTGRVAALDLPGQIAQALSLGIINESEAALLRDYDAKVQDIINVDDFAPHELGSGADS